MIILSKTYWNHLNTDYQLISWLFFRGLALIYLSAFASMAVQIEGLVGSNGILPFSDKLALFAQLYPEQKIWQIPTIFWFDVSDRMLRSVCYAGIVISGLLLFNLFTRFSLIVCYVLYLSVVKAGQDFTAFQWDVFLLETGFLAILLSWVSGIIVLLFRWLLARFIFMGGMVKIASADPTWANMTALNFHFETQPLPSPFAYYAHHLPSWIQQVFVSGVFFIELIVPFFIFLPRPYRVFACYAFIVLQVAILLTGNYTFFNLLTILLCLFLLEDNNIIQLFPNRLISCIRLETPKPAKLAHIFSGLWASLVLLVCISQFFLYHANRPLFDPLYTLMRTTSRLGIVNNYGPFAVMTTARNEIIIQGSNDAIHWSDYQFKYKPGELNGELSWNIPHQPRLDWQMWFAALRTSKIDAWFNSFLNKLLQGSTPVLSLLATNPFQKNPPLYIRAVLYKYTYTARDQYKSNRQVWQRQYIGVYDSIRTLK